MSIILQTPQEVLHELRERFKSRRLLLNYTQEGLAKRAGMSWSSLKRFERTGQISFESLLKIALVLGCLDDFNVIGKTTFFVEGRSLDDILATTKIAKKGRIK